MLGKRPQPVITDQLGLFEGLLEPGATLRPIPPAHRHKAQAVESEANPGIIPGLSE
jgi:hypothetical protein